MLACMDLKERNYCIKLDKKVLTKQLGMLKRLLFYFWVKSFFNKFKHLQIEEETAIVEFVAIISKYKRMGVASTLIKHLFSLPAYKHYVLEMDDTNLSALELYRKLGFREVYRINVEHAIGNHNKINNILYMKYSKG